MLLVFIRLCMKHNFEGKTRKLIMVQCHIF